MPGILLYGGSFNPIHHGHLISARAVAESLDVARVVLIPSARPPHKEGSGLASADDRLAMCRAAVAGDSLFEVSECEIRSSGGPNYTLLTVRQFRAEIGPTEPLAWLLGMDSLIDLPTWHRADELARECRLVTAVRPGFVPPSVAHLAPVLGGEMAAQVLRQSVPTPAIDISASRIRERVRLRLSIRYLAPDAVLEIIARRGLYAR